MILIAKCFDGFTDLIFGHCIDRTKTKMGKARPWMFFAQFGVSICVVLLFSIPSGMSDTMKYVWFFLTYVCEMFLFYYRTMGSGVYYFTYIMRDANLYSTYSSANLLPMIPGLILTPILVKKFGMYKSNLAGYALSIAASILLMFGGFNGKWIVFCAAVDYDDSSVYRLVLPKGRRCEQKMSRKSYTEMIDSIIKGRHNL